MTTYKLTIELLSDLCVSDGGVYNSLLDTDICKDTYGIPYIPAKRIKGCLKEAAEEMASWGADIPVELLFGKEGEAINAGILRIGNAKIDSYNDYKKEIEANRLHCIYHPQNVVDCFTYIRHQTSIDDKTGSAKKNSLRSIRVIKKGLKFVSDITVTADEDNNFETALNDMCHAFESMGLGRTRGFGEIKASVKKISFEEEETDSTKEVFFREGDAIRYTVTLEEPMVCKSLNGGEQSSKDYLDGSKILGLYAGTLKNNDLFLEIMSGDDVYFSNAYILEGDNRLTEVPGYINGIKNDSERYINKLYYAVEDRENEERQLNAMKHCYIRMDENGNLIKKSVQMEERYHHRRPVDKSIGHATAEDENDGSVFYQISSIDRGQMFEGYIMGNPQKLAKIYKTMKNVRTCYMGAGRTAEYGRCCFSEEKKSLSSHNELCEEIVVELNSPAIVYNDRAFDSTNVDDLVAEINAALGIHGESVSGKLFLKYTDVGGYNVTWNRRKPHIKAFDQGTALVLALKEPMEIDLDQIFFIGERNAEGYGECVVRKIMNQGKLPKEGRIQKEFENSDNSKKIDVSINPLAKKICQRKYGAFLQTRAREMSDKDLIKNKKLTEEAASSTVSNLLAICREVNTMEDVKDGVKVRFDDKNTNEKKAKSDKASAILEFVKEENKENVKKFGESMGIRDFKPESNDAEKDLLEAFLLELKYRIRQKKTQAKEGEING